MKLRIRFKKSLTRVKEAPRHSLANFELPL